MASTSPVAVFRSPQENERKNLPGLFLENDSMKLSLLELRAVSPLSLLELKAVTSPR